MEDEMTADDEVTKNEWQRRFAVGAFNLTWDLLDKSDRGVEDNDRMVHAAHASRFHWGEVGTALEWARGEWQISRVYAVLERPAGAIYHAQRCLEFCEANNIGDFDLAFAYEALARACAVGGDLTKRDRNIALAQAASERIEDEGNRKYFLTELATVPRSIA
jgi:hypothetical protein